MRRQHQTLGPTLFVRVCAFSPAPQGRRCVLRKAAPALPTSYAVGPSIQGGRGPRERVG